MKVSVCVRVNYNYEVEIPDNLVNPEDFDYDLVDAADEAYGDICKVLTKYHYNFDGMIESVVDDATGDCLYTYD